MKKLLTALCVAACGFGAAAQAQQVSVSPDAARFERQGVHNLRVEMPTMPTVETPQFKQAGEVFDTLYIHAEYTSPETCGRGFYLLRWTDDYFSSVVTPHAFGSNLSGTGETGLSYITADNLYYNYSRHTLGDYSVVGATAVVYRQGSTAGWDRVNTERFAEHMTDIEGTMVPDLPFKVKGYGEVVRQPAVTYYDATELDIVQALMPVTMQGAAESKVDYVEFEPGRDQDGDISPVLRYRGGFFDKKIPAGRNFAVSFQAQLEGDKTYDSLWNWAIGAKSTRECTMPDKWVAWIRADYSNENAWRAWAGENSGPFDVSEQLPDGFAPEGCPQHDNGQSLFVYAFSQLFMIGGSEGVEFYPAIYPIIQYTGKDSGLANEKDVYAQSISVYPLPAAETVNFVAMDPILRIEIYNMAGSLLKHVTMNSNVAEMDVTDMAPGTYIARIMTEKGVASKKLLVK